MKIIKIILNMIILLIFPALSLAELPGVIMEHGKYSESYMSNWAELPTGKELIQKNLAKNIKAGLALGKMPHLTLKPEQVFKR